MLELGAGQTTILFDAWASETDSRIITLEHDEIWVNEITNKLFSGKVDVVHAPLAPLSTSQGIVDWYALPPLDSVSLSGFDLVIVDGPIGTKHLSRYGIVERINEWIAPDWMVLWDDLDRPADLDSFGRLVAQLRLRGVVHDHLLLDGDRTIGLIHTPGFQAMHHVW